MSRFVYKERTRRKLPHWHPPDSTLFVTFRLAGTIPKSILRFHYAQKEWLKGQAKLIANLKSDSPEIVAIEKSFKQFWRRWFVTFEEILHKAETGPTWLRDQAVAEVVAEALHRRDGVVYRLDAYCIMSNHVHTVFAPFLSERELREGRMNERLCFFSRNQPLNRIMKSLKGWTAWQCNRILGRKGTFWDQESYDHVVRSDAEFLRIVQYVLNNPIKAGLVKEWREWKWSYVRDSCGLAE